ncbi:hypothetical protein GH733_008295 [Mirounga leonina]|nr:hypothetical protein GH733_008295 [Mirounga leonina]
MTVFSKGSSHSESAFLILTWTTGAETSKKYYGLDTKWGDIEQWMEDSERYSRRSRRNTSASDEDERMSVGSRGSLRVSNQNDWVCMVYGWPSLC